MGVPAARGHGVMEVQRFGAYAGPELVMILPVGIARVDRPKGSIGPGTFVPSIASRAIRLIQRGLPQATRGDTLGKVTGRHRGF